jgi:F-type H+-transporting ATPase subunit delta
VITSRVARRYAAAIYDVAESAGRVEPVRTDMDYFAGTARRSRDLDTFLRDYTIPRTRRHAVLEAMFRERTDPLTWRFIRFLESKRRLGFLKEIALAFGELYNRRQGILRVALSSAFAMTGEEQQAIGVRLKERFRRQIALETDVDTRLLGGFRLRIEDTVYDYSTYGALEALRNRMVEG